MANVNITKGSTVGTTWDVNANGGSSKGVFRFYLNIKLNSQDDVANTSNVTVTLKLSCNFSSSTMWSGWGAGSAPTAKVGYRKGTSGDYTYSDEVSFSSYYANTHNNQTTLVTKTWDIPNNSDGTLSAQFNFSWADNTNGFNYAPPTTTRVYPDSTSVVVFPTIPRASSFSSLPTSATSNSQISYTIASSSTSFTHEISISYSGVSQTITNSTTGATVTGTISISANIRNKMRDNKASSAVLSIVLSTKNGSTVVGTNSYQLTLNLPTPTIVVYGNGTTQGGSVTCDTHSTKIVISGLDTEAAYYVVGRYWNNTLVYEDKSISSASTTLTGLYNILFEAENTKSTSCQVTARLSVKQGTSTAAATAVSLAEDSYTVTIPTNVYKPSLQYWNGSAVTTTAVSPTYLKTTSYAHTRYGSTTTIPAFLAGWEGATIPFKESVNGHAEITNREITITNKTTSTKINISSSASVSTVSNNYIVTITTDTLPASTINYNFSITLKVIDSRGTTTTLESASVTATGYKVPSVSYTIARANSDGSAFDGEGNKVRAEISATARSTVTNLYIYSISISCTDSNVTYTKSDTSTTTATKNVTWAPLSLTNGSNTLDPFSTSKQYNMVLTVIDSLKFTQVINLTVPSATVQLSLHKNIGVGLGTVAVQGKVSSSLPIDTNGNNIKLGILNPVSISSTSNTNKYIKITINSSKKWMLSFTVQLYSSYKQKQIRISGYHYLVGTPPDTWYSPLAEIITSTDNETITVSFGYDSDYTAWVCIPVSYYYGVNITDVVNGYIQVLEDPGNLFTLTQVDSIPNTVEHTVTASKIANSASSATTATKLGSSTVGDTSKPIYLNSGTPTAIGPFLRTGTSTYLSSNNTVNGEIQFYNTNPTYSSADTITDTASGIVCANKGSRYLINELLVSGIVAPHTSGYSTNGFSTALDTIRFYRYTGTSGQTTSNVKGGNFTGLTKTATIDSNGIFKPSNWPAANSSFFLGGIVGIALSGSTLRIQIPIPPGCKDTVTVAIDTSSTSNAQAQLGFHGAGATLNTQTMNGVTITDRNYTSIMITVSFAGANTFATSYPYIFKNGHILITY